MSTVTTFSGPVIHLAASGVVEREKHEDISHADVHTSSDALTVGTVSAKRMQISDMGGFSALLPDGLVAEYASVTEELNIIDGGIIKVQSSVNPNVPVIVIGKPAALTVDNSGLLVKRGHQEIFVNASQGIRTTTGLSINTQNVRAAKMIEAKTGNFWTSCKTINLKCHRITPYTNNKISMNGDVHITKKLTVQDLSVLGKATLVRKHDGEDGHNKSLTLDDESLYIGLMRRSYDRATQKPVTH